MKEPFPVPYLLLVIGYTLMLVIDKVLFDSHFIYNGGSDDLKYFDIMEKTLKMKKAKEDNQA